MTAESRAGPVHTAPRLTGAAGKPHGLSALADLMRRPSNRSGAQHGDQEFTGTADVPRWQLAAARFWPPISSGRRGRRESMVASRQGTRD
jgi:hypothetical protein